jgi:hypothetical protein
VLHTSPPPGVLVPVHETPTDPLAQPWTVESAWHVPEVIPEMLAQQYPVAPLGSTTPSLHASVESLKSGENAPVHVYPVPDVQSSVESVPHVPESEVVVVVQPATARSTSARNKVEDFIDRGPMTSRVSRPFNFGRAGPWA